MIEFTLPYPISANRYWASRVIKAKATGKWMAMTYVTPEAVAYKAQVVAAVRAAGVRAPCAGRYVLHLRLYPHRPQDWQARQRKLGELWDDTVQCIDLGNAEKVLGDALQGVLIGDDKFARRIVLERMEPDGEARIVVRFAEMALQSQQAGLELVGGQAFEPLAF